MNESDHFCLEVEWLVGVRADGGGAGERVVRGGGEAEDEGLPLPVGLDGWDYANVIGAISPSRARFVISEFLFSNEWTNLTEKKRKYGPGETKRKERVH